MANFGKGSPSSSGNWVAVDSGVVKRGSLEEQRVNAAFASQDAARKRAEKLKKQQDAWAAHVEQQLAIGVLPWESNAFASKIPDEEKSFFGPYGIDGSRWNKLFPYRLVVIDVTKGNNIVTESDPEFRRDTRNAFSEVVSDTGIEYVVVQQINNSWEAPFPISPQQLMIQDQFAINNTATMRGIVEEHNGVKYKMISASGTFGIWPSKPTQGGNVPSPTSSIGDIFGNTLQATEALTDSASGLASSVQEMFTNKHPNKQANPESPPASSFGETSTGYYYALFMSQFLERYAQAKKRPENKGWRLVLDIPKQNQSFVVTPLSYTTKQSKEFPNEMRFDIKLKAWKRIVLNSQFVSPQEAGLPEIEISDFQKFINIINDVRNVLGNALDLIKAVRSDFQSVFNILRQTALAIKDATGVVFAAIDLPRQLIADFKSAIEDSLKDVLEAFQRPNDRFREDNEIGTLVNNAIPLKASTSAQRAGKTAAAIASKNRISEGLSSDQIKSGSLGQNATQQLATDPINNVFSNPEENFELFNGVTVDDLTLTPEQEDAIETEVERIRLLTIDDFRDFKTELLSLANDIANNFGASDETYAQIYSTTDPKDRAIPMSIEENEILDAIFDAIQVYDRLTATREWDDGEIESPLEYVGGLAQDVGIDFEQFPSKIPVPVPFGSTIEEIAARYMGDADKWLEIATLNMLRSPYIDEEGFTIDFQSNGDGRQFTIFDDEERLFIGQTILLQSDTTTQISRNIINLEEISDDNYLVTVDGQADLDSLTTADNARMQGFLPGTVNSQNQIFIPVDDPSNVDDRIFEIPNVSDNYLAKLSKVDFLLNDGGDIILSSTGDFRLSTGLNNLIQALKLKIKTRKGTLLRHLDYGLGIGVGFSVSDLQTGVIVKEMNKMVAEDPRFESVEKVQLTLSGSTLGIDMTIRIANNTGVLPISLDVPIR